jgi:hypothetical protein
MSNESIFPRYQSSRLARADVVAYLLNLNKGGWQVYDAGGDAFVVRLGTSRHGAERLARIQRDVVDWEVICNGLPGDWLQCGRPTSVAELEEAMAQAAAFLSVRGFPAAPPSSVRLSEKAPATNIYRISTLIAGATIEAVFDPYLDNVGLQSLTDIASFGALMGGALRVLTSRRVVACKSHRLTESFVERWIAEHECREAEVRVMASMNEHRRFLLVSGRKSVVLGPSLNSLAKNEAASLEASSEDREFFDATWRAAEPFVKN